MTPPDERADESTGEGAPRTPPYAPDQPHDQSHDPRHGVTLEQMLAELAADLGWTAMGRRVPIRCFTHEPSVASSLKFLRRTPWARTRVEALYVATARERARRRGV